MHRGYFFLVFYVVFFNLCKAPYGNFLDRMLYKFWYYYIYYQ